MKAFNNLPNTSDGRSIIAPSLFAADICCLRDELESVEQAGARFLHIDIMDGHFVPNLSFGSNIVSGLRAKSKMIFDVHLMLEKPSEMIETFIKAGADMITVHAEIEEEIEDIYRICEHHGIRFGLSLCPKTTVRSIDKYIPMLDLILIMGINPGYGGQQFMPETLGRIREAVQLRRERDGHYLVSVDGGVNESTAAEISDAGADILVAGTAVFGKADRKVALEELTLTL